METGLESESGIASGKRTRLLFGLSGCFGVLSLITFWLADIFGSYPDSRFYERSTHIPDKQMSLEYLSLSLIFFFLCLVVLAWGWYRTASRNWVNSRLEGLTPEVEDVDEAGTPQT